MNKLIGVLGISILCCSSPAYGAVLQRSDVFSFDNSLPVENATATLERREDSVEFSLNTTLDSGAYTVWWVIFNNPESCVGGCGVDDLGILEVNASAFWATGAVVENDNLGSFNAQLGENQLPTGEDQVLFGEGLTDSFEAEIHLIARTHGEVIPGVVQQQITTFNGGCPPNTCEDVQFAVFPAVSVPESSSKLGLLALGGLGIASVLKRKLNK
ncbi:MAG: hypothetical protein QNJ65_15880 [Xenococcaceae cyanobacterium MO_234.B1]|nr:hypothetical protein [Xenococcaceae cyanobacterium MO_234.B1]